MMELYVVHERLTSDAETQTDGKGYSMYMATEGERVLSLLVPEKMSYMKRFIRKKGH